MKQMLNYVLHESHRIYLSHWMLRALHWLQTLGLHSCHCSHAFLCCAASEGCSWGESRDSCPCVGPSGPVLVWAENLISLDVLLDLG